MAHIAERNAAVCGFDLPPPALNTSLILSLLHVLQTLKGFTFHNPNIIDMIVTYNSKRKSSRYT